MTAIQGTAHQEQRNQQGKGDQEGGSQVDDARQSRKHGRRQQDRYARGRGAECGEAG
jgi:hypothetical protein